MQTIISGSIAYDTIYDFPEHFADTLKSESLDYLNLTFEARSMRKAFGGCAGNIALSLKALGGDPLIWAAAGQDFQPYFHFLKEHRIRTEGIGIYPDDWTAQCTITTDIKGCQLTTFLKGAAERAGDVPLKDISSADMAILAPSCKNTTLAHAKRLSENSIPFLLDLGQTTPLFTGKEYLSLLENAFATAFSDYEADLIRSMTGLNARELSLRGKTVFQTHGSQGSTVWENGEPTEIGTPLVNRVKNPVGAGDFYRGGLLWGLSQGFNNIVSAQIGSIMGAARVTGDDLHLPRLRLSYEHLWGKAPF